MSTEFDERLKLLSDQDYVIEGVLTNRLLITTDLVITDILKYNNCEMANTLLSERKCILNSFNWQEGISLQQYIFVDTKEKLKAACDIISLNNDKILIKPYNSYYPYDGIARDWFLFINKDYVKLEYKGTLLMKQLPLMKIEPSNKNVYNTVEEFTTKIQKQIKDYIIIEEYFDDQRVLLHKTREGIKMYSNEKEIIDRSDIIEAAKELTKQDMIIEGYLQPNKLLITDILFFNKSLTEIELYERKKALNALTYNDKIMKIKAYVINNKEELITAVNKLKNKVILKPWDMPYLIGGTADYTIILNSTK